MRDKIWRLVTATHEVGTMLPRWLLAIRAVLYPLDSFYWRMSRSRGYDSLRDIWTIEGVRYSGEGLRALAQAQGEVYRITCVSGCVTLERVNEPDPFDCFMSAPCEFEGEDDGDTRRII